MTKYRKSRKAAKNVFKDDLLPLQPQQQPNWNTAQSLPAVPFGNNLNKSPYTIQNEMGGAPMLQKVINPAVLKQHKKTLKAPQKPFVPGKYYG